MWRLAVPDLIADLLLPALSFGSAAICLLHLFAGESRRASWSVPLCSTGISVSCVGSSKCRAKLQIFKVGWAEGGQM